MRVDSLQREDGSNGMVVAVTRNLFFLAIQKTFDRFAASIEQG
jgi:hypothetical protein